MRLDPNLLLFEGPFLLTLVLAIPRILSHCLLLSRITPILGISLVGGSWDGDLTL